MENVDFPKGDPPLTELGREQARLLGERLAGAGFQGRVYTSPYRRTVETGHIIAEHVDAPVVLARPIREIVKHAEAMVDFQGQTVAELQAAFPRVVPGEDYEYPWWRGEAELAEDVEARVRPFIDALIEREAGDALLIGHGASMIACARHVLRRFAPELLPQVPPMWNCGLSSFRVQPTFEAARLACVEHLPEDAVTTNSESRADFLARHREQQSDPTATQAGEAVGEQAESR